MFEGRWIVVALAGLMACGGSSDEETEETGEVGDTLIEASDDRVRCETTLGAFVIDLDEELAPVTVANFLTYVDEGFYDGDDDLGATVFHRVIDGFVVQGGGYTVDGSQKATHDPIVNESGNGLENLRGTVAMARTSDPDSATSQFYVNLVDNGFLDDPPGYAVFGEVVEGMEVFDAMAGVATDSGDWPLDDIVMTDCERD